MAKHRFLAIIGVFAAVAVGTISVSAQQPSLLSVGGWEQAFGRRDLWRVVAYACVPSAAIGLPFPCDKVHPGKAGESGWAQLPVGTAHILTIPTDRISGIESPLAQGPDGARFWQAAWDARQWVETNVGHPVPRTGVGLAINSAYGRSQDQFHIHTGCIDPAVEAALMKDRARIGTQWMRLTTPLHGQSYLARRIFGDEIGEQNVIDLLPQQAKANRSILARQSLVVVGAEFENGALGFYVLNAQTTREAVASGSSLLVATCE